MHNKNFEKSSNYTCSGKRIFLPPYLHLKNNASQRLTSRYYVVYMPARGPRLPLAVSSLGNCSTRQTVIDDPTSQPGQITDTQPISIILLSNSQLYSCSWPRLHPQTQFVSTHTPSRPGPVSNADSQLPHLDPHIPGAARYTFRRPPPPPPKKDRENRQQPWQHLPPLPAMIPTRTSS